MKYLLVISLVAFVSACCTHKKTADITQSTSKVMADSGLAVTGPHAIIYRTRMDVDEAVPITLSEDGKEVISYPHPNDLRKGDGYSTPTALGEGYLLDNRGIGPNTVFLQWSYAEYAAMESTPTLEQLLTAVEHRDPFREMYDCGVRSRYTDPVKEMGDIVRSGTLSSRCKKLK